MPGIDELTKSDIRDEAMPLKAPAEVPSIIFGRSATTCSRYEDIPSVATRATQHQVAGLNEVKQLIGEPEDLSVAERSRQGESNVEAEPRNSRRRCFFRSRVLMCSSVRLTAWAAQARASEAARRLLRRVWRRLFARVRNFNPRMARSFAARLGLVHRVTRDTSNILEGTVANLARQESDPSFQAASPRGWGGASRDHARRCRGAYEYRRAASSPRRPIAHETSHRGPYP